ncbi:hypothetical protein BT63DRAFT_426487 [Microthyrium microscopicum]|uniref:ER-bound oxygenase mpaB/mpaB'/Rubber oxygenase catalytic domain-containing protein n=1 Tax=Microthyrium microscopicum TaxID=703497 RepID=A0A6A6U7N3_9PEZI|nr:hypothetical protein BT63DRAFT_426487 [Microthyrium microscopicum]
MENLVFDWNWTSVALVAVGYVCTIRLLRYRTEGSLQKKYPYKSRETMKKMTLQEAYEIQKVLFSQEFPFTAEKALQFALFRTYGIPSISTLLVKTRQLSTRSTVGKRYADTAVLIEEFMGNAPNHPRTIAAISRMNYLHAIYQKQNLISNDDLLYTLSLFALEPMRWFARYEWRSLNDLEKCAFGVFWKAQGDAMGIDMSCLSSKEAGSGLEWMEKLEAWSDAYEEKAMVPGISNKTTADQTVAVLLWDVPSALHPFGRKVVSALMDERLRKAMMYDAPPSWLQSTVEGALKGRAVFIRYLMPPRPYWLRHRNIDEEPDSDGRLHFTYYAAEPWYVRRNIWTRNDLTAWVKWMMGNPIPDKQFASDGYLIPEVGPKHAFGKGLKEQEIEEEKLRKMKRGGCPFAI